MADRPILFSAPMVRALLAGTKTQTRRVVKDTGLYAIDAAIHGPETAARELLALAAHCRYGQPGDRLWVRETWLTVNGDDTFYRADYLQDQAGDRAHGVVWKPSIHMPRSRSRITLEVTGVRVERLQDISEADAEAEGIAYSERYQGWCIGQAEHFHSADPRQSYFSLWETINGHGSVDADPWVWAVSFRVVKP